MGRYAKSLSAGQPRPTIAVTLDRPKTAALAFDYVYGPAEANIPGGIGPGMAWFPSPKSRKDAFLRVKVTRPDGTANLEVTTITNALPILQAYLQHRKVQLFAALRAEGLNAVEFLENHSQTYSQGNDRYIFAALEGVLEVSENDLEWDQVKEFRHDPDALRAYRALLQWFNEECIGMELREVEHHLCTTYELAQDKLKKHGIKVGFGTVATVLAGVSGFAVALPLGGVAGVLAAGLAISAMGHQVIAKLCDERLLRKETQLRGPTAYVQKYAALKP